MNRQRMAVVRLMPSKQRDLFAYRLFCFAYLAWLQWKVFRKDGVSTFNSADPPQVEMKMRTWNQFYIHGEIEVSGYFRVLPRWSASKHTYQYLILYVWYRIIWVTKLTHYLLRDFTIFVHVWNTDFVTDRLAYCGVLAKGFIIFMLLHFTGLM